MSAVGIHANKLLITAIAHSFTKTYLFIFGREFPCKYLVMDLFKSAVNCSEYVASDDGLINKQWLIKQKKGSGHCLI